MDLESISALVHHDLILTSAARPHQLHDQLRHAADSGVLSRVRRGAYVKTTTWRQLGYEDRHRLLARAVHETRATQPVFSHWTAAALWRLPIVGPRLRSVHLVDDTARGGRSDANIVRHPGLERIVPVIHDGLLLTSPAATVIDVAAIGPFAAAVAVADAALHVPEHGTALCTREELLECLERVRGRKGWRQAEHVVAFADARSASAGESVGRANMHLVGFVMPELQSPFYDSIGLIGFGDYFWKDIRRVGEFDGNGKYMRDEFLMGRTPAEVVIAEKKREDRLRAIGLGVTRWGWDVALDPARLAKHLDAAGVPRLRRAR